uniref:WD repeat domain 55 n=1 Tax=Cyanoderma ruficeps TaxID=181631 RepID=A0A8C3XCN8_9PASS
ARVGLRDPGAPGLVPRPRSPQEPQDSPDSPEPAARQPRVRDTPEDICLEATANAIALHPARPLLAAGDVDGDVYLYSYSCTEGENRQLWSSGHHLKSCRDVAFSQDGQKLFTVSKDKSIHILTAEEGRLETRFPKAHESALNCVLPIDNHIFATGDDGGAVKVWDLRRGSAILEARQQEEYISAMTVDGNGKILLTASGDGTLGVFNVKRRRFELLSEPQNGDLTSVVLMKVGTAPQLGAGAHCPLFSLRVFCSASASLPSLVSRGGGRWRVAPAKAPFTSSTGTALGLPATALRSGQRPLTAWCPSRTASYAWGPWTESSGR